MVALKNTRPLLWLVEEMIDKAGNAEVHRKMYHYCRGRGCPWEAIAEMRLGSESTWITRIAVNGTEQFSEWRIIIAEWR